MISKGYKKKIGNSETSNICYLSSLYFPRKLTFNSKMNMIKVCIDRYYHVLIISITHDLRHYSTNVGIILTKIEKWFSHSFFLLMPLLFCFYFEKYTQKFHEKAKKKKRSVINKKWGWNHSPKFTQLLHTLRFISCFCFRFQISFMHTLSLFQ